MILFNRLAQSSSQNGRFGWSRRGAGAVGVVVLSLGGLSSCTEMGANGAKCVSGGNSDTAAAGKGGRKADSALQVGSLQLSRKNFDKKIALFASAQVAGAPDAESVKQLEGRMYVDKAKGTYSPDFTAFVLNDLMIDEIVAKEAQSRKICVTIPAAPLQSTLEGLGGKEVFDKLPADYRARIMRREAEFEAIQADIKKGLGGTGEGYAKAHPEDFLEVCASHILVATEAEANKVIADVAAGQKFEDLAKKLSTDPGSGANGGDLGCTSPSTYVPEFAEATKTLKVNTLSKPVKTQFGYHVIKVKKRQPGTTEASSVKLDETAQKQFSEALVKRLKTTTIAVDPTLASIEKNAEQGFPQIVPKAAALVPTNQG